jgi:hypothetical protein
MASSQGDSGGGYVLQCEHVYLRGGRSFDFETIAHYRTIPDVALAVHEHLVREFGDDYKSDVFESVETYRDDAHCGGVLVEATDMEGDTLRFWLQPVESRGV